MSRRYLLVVIGVVAAVIAFFVLRGGTKQSPADRTADSADGTGASGPDRGSLPPVARPGRARGEGPAIESADPATGTRTYVTDTGNIVRDHRENVANPVALPVVQPPGDRTMNPAVTGDLYRQLAPIVRACGKDAGGDRGANPVANVTLTVDVAAGQLTTADATAVTSDITGPAADQVVACIRDRASALTVAANGEPDRTGYVVQYPIRLPN